VTPASPLFDALYLAAAAGYLLTLISEAMWPRGRAIPLAAGLAAHLSGLVVRALTISYFPLTNKFESFYAFSFAVFAVSLAVHHRASRGHRIGLLVVGAIFYGLTLAFSSAVFFPPPLMQTIWYPLHVPASFFAYALWTSAAAAGLAVLCGSTHEPTRRAVAEHAFWGWCAFSLSMIFGGLWGYVAWGAWFLWDPKVVWSVVLWLFYSSFVHLGLWPGGIAPRTRAALAVAGLLVMLTAYVGTSFFFLNSSHSFR